MFNPILQRRQEVINRIQKSVEVDTQRFEENLFEKAELYMDDFLIEKAKRQVGETKEINGKTYVWSEYQPGRFDWKVANKKKSGGEEGNEEQSQPKSLADHAKGTSTETLKKVANSGNAPQELKDAANKELASRGKGENGNEKNESVVSKIENKLKTLNFDKIRGLLDGYEDVEDMKGISDDEKKLYEVISEHVTWSDEDKYNADPEAYESKIKKNGGVVFKLKDNTPVEIRDLKGMKSWLDHRNGETDEANENHDEEEKKNTATAKTNISTAKGMAQTLNNYEGDVSYFSYMYGDDEGVDPDVAKVFDLIMSGGDDKTEVQTETWDYKDETKAQVWKKKMELKGYHVVDLSPDSDTYSFAAFKDKQGKKKPNK